MSRTFLSYFDAKECRELNAEMESSLVKLTGQALVAIVGITGRGKSTTLEYLRGSKINKIKTGLGRFHYELDESTPESARIGHGASETLFPVAYNVARRSLKLLDTGGLGDTRGPNVTLNVSLGLKHVSQVSNIKGIVIVLTYEDITESRGRNIRELFELVRKLTSEVRPEILAFCVTKLPAHLDQYTKEAVIADILIKTEETKTIMRRGVSSADTTKLIKVEQTVSALDLMNAGNLFLTRNLENQEQQVAFQQAFFSYAEQMPGLKQGLNLAIDEITRLKLMDWSKDLAQQGATQLTEGKTIDAELDKTRQKLQKASGLHRRLIEVHDRLTEISRMSNEFDGRKQQLTVERDALFSRRNELVVDESQRIQIPLPRKGSGITGLISRQFEAHPIAHFENLQPLPNTKIVSKRDGSFTYCITHKVTGNEEMTRITGGVDVVCRRENLPEYKERFQELNEALETVNTQLPQLNRKKQHCEKEIGKLKTEILSAAGELDINVRDNDSMGDILVQLDRQINSLSGQSRDVQSRKEANEAEVAPHLENYRFLCEIAQRAELLNQPIVAQFIRLYQEVYGAFGEQVADRPASRSSVHSSVVAMFGEQRQQQHRDAAAATIQSSVAVPHTHQP